MNECGLINQWMKIFQPNAHRCLEKAKEITSFSPHNSFVPLTLKNLNGAFVILLFGFLIAFVIFIAENILFRSCCKNKKSN